MSDDSKAIVHDSNRESLATVLDVIARAASDPSVNVEKLERLLAIQKQYLADQRRTSYFAALARLQASLPQITKAGTIMQGTTVRNRFAKIEDIDVVIRPYCADEGFSFSFDSKMVQGGAEYSCAMAHREGHVETKSLFLPLDTGQGRNAVQSAGSTISYAKRYLIGMHLHLVTRDEDTDANESAMVSEEQAKTLRERLADAGGSDDRFLKWLGVATFEEIPAARYMGALHFIEQKKARR